MRAGKVEACHATKYKDRDLDIRFLSAFRLCSVPCAKQMISIYYAYSAYIKSYAGGLTIGLDESVSIRPLLYEQHRPALKETCKMYVYKVITK